MVANTMQLGDLTLAFTTAFQLRWNDQGSGATRNGAFWHPIPLAGFHALGTIGLSHYSDPNGTVAAICVQESSSGNGALAPPTDYELFYKDSGTGARMNGSCWRPIPPQGYVALGDVFPINTHNKPSLDDVVCVREDLTFGANAGQSIWSDQKSGGAQDFSAWQNDVPPNYTDMNPGATRGLIAPNTMVGRANYTQPQHEPDMNVLCLPLPSAANEVGTAPTLTSRSKPAQSTPPAVDHTVEVPFTAVNDDAKSLAWKLANSPAYRLQRQNSWRLLLFNDNNTAAEQFVEESVTVGVENATSQSFSTNTGVSITTETGVGVGALGTTFSATVSVEFGYESATSVTELESRTVTRRLTAPPQTAAAIWVGSYSFQVLRGDNTLVGNPLTFDSDSFTYAQYPPPAT